jgi:short chain dehydrogenase
VTSIPATEPCVPEGENPCLQPLRRRRPPNLPQRTLAPAKPDGRVAVVTGGTRGIGAAICHSLMGQGATVAAGYSRDREKAEALLSRTERAWGQGSLHTARAAARCGQEALRSRCTQCAPTRERRRAAWRPDEGSRSRPESPLVRTLEGAARERAAARCSLTVLAITPPCDTKGPASSAQTGPQRRLLAWRGRPTSSS